MRPSHMFIQVVFLLVCLDVFAQDWPQYLGPNRDSTSPQKALLRTWPENGPEILWTIDVGIGFGGPVVKDGKVYLVGTKKIGRCYSTS